MADYCQECSIEFFGEDLGELAGLGRGKELPEGHGWTALCEGCGPILVDDAGKRIPIEEKGEEDVQDKVPKV